MRTFCPKYRISEGGMVMAKNSFSVRFLVIFLLLSFSIFNIACLPSYQSTEIISVSSQPDSVETSFPLSMFVHNNLDCLEAENVSYRIGSDQKFLSRKLSSQNFFSVYSALSSICLSTSYLRLGNNELYVQPCSGKIADFMRLKDGMV